MFEGQSTRGGECPNADITITRELRRKYSLREFLGEGQYGSVWRCKERATGRSVALKYVDLEACNPKARLAALREIEVLSKLVESGDCSHVVSLRDVFADNNSLFLVMDYCGGGDLLGHIESQPDMRLLEPEARHLFVCVACGVKQCHDNSIIHRDIKPENILLCPTTLRSLSSGSVGRAASAYTAKLADFGLAVQVPCWQQINGYAGSKPYEAPEVMANQPYDDSADIWSLGVTLYAMLSGMWPTFRGGDRVLDEEADWELPCWSEVSADAKDLIRRMLTVEPDQRLTIEQVLAHPWTAAALPKPETRMSGASSGRLISGDGSGARNAMARGNKSSSYTHGSVVVRADPRDGNSCGVGAIPSSTSYTDICSAGVECDNAARLDDRSSRSGASTPRDRDDASPRLPADHHPYHHASAANDGGRRRGDMQREGGGFSFPIAGGRQQEVEEPSYRHHCAVPPSPSKDARSRASSSLARESTNANPTTPTTVLEQSKVLGDHHGEDGPGAAGVSESFLQAFAVMAR